MQQIIEYGTRTNFYTSLSKDSDFDRNEWRTKQIDLILSTSANKFYKHFPLFITIDDETKSYEWIKEALENDDDLNLTFKSNICRNSLNKL